jgi:hypothetical protein
LGAWFLAFFRQPDSAKLRGMFSSSRLGALILALALILSAAAARGAEVAAGSFPLPLDAYPAAVGSPVWQILQQRARLEPFNVVATLIFFLAITHTFLAPRFQRISHRLAERHRGASGTGRHEGAPAPVSFWAEVFHFLGEVEAIFGIWVVPLLIAIAAAKGWPTARDYLGHGLNFTEPLFVVVIMTIAASRPMLQLSESLMARFAGLGGGSPAAWWVSVLTLGPILGSFITEPAAMTISALLLSDKFYRLKPNPTFAYGTLGLLFVNISVGGTLTHFAAPPVLMVAAKWGWGTPYMFLHFGWKALAGIVGANLLYAFWFRAELRRLQSEGAQPGTSAVEKGPLAPWWVMLVHVLFLGWTVFNSHFPVLFIGGFLFYLAFTQATEPHQGELALRPALLVGFFLAGLVVHGGLQGWWIGPVLGKLPEVPLFLASAGLTSFNDNAAITYLASLVPDLSESLRYAVTAGAVAGGGLTVIANAPNPAGQSILNKFFPDGISPLGLLLGALMPTVLVSLMFVLLR